MRTRCQERKCKHVQTAYADSIWNPFNKRGRRTLLANTCMPTLHQPVFYLTHILNSIQRSRPTQNLPFLQTSFGRIVRHAVPARLSRHAQHHPKLYTFLDSLRKDSETTRKKTPAISPLCDQPPSEGRRRFPRRKASFCLAPPPPVFSSSLPLLAPDGRWS